MKKSWLEITFIILWLIIPIVLFLPSALFGLVGLSLLIGGLILSVQKTDFKLFVEVLIIGIFALLIAIFYFIPTIVIFLIRKHIKKKNPKKLKYFYTVSIIIALVVIFIAILYFMNVGFSSISS